MASSSVRFTTHVERELDSEGRLVLLVSVMVGSTLSLAMVISPHHADEPDD